MQKIDTIRQVNHYIVGLVSQMSRIIMAVWETAPTFFDQESLNLGINRVAQFDSQCLIKIHKLLLFLYSSLRNKGRNVIFQ